MTAPKHHRRQPRRSNPQTFEARLASINENSALDREERLRLIALERIDPDAFDREVYFYLQRLNLLASAVPEDTTPKQITEAASKVRAIPQRIRPRLPLHRGVTRHDVRIVTGWLWIDPEMPRSINVSFVFAGGDVHVVEHLPGAKREALRSGTEVGEYLRRLEGLSGRRGREKRLDTHTHAKINEAIMSQRDADPLFLARLEAAENEKLRLDQTRARQTWQSLPSGYEEAEATDGFEPGECANGLSIKKSRNRQNEYLENGIVKHTKKGKKYSPAKAASPGRRLSPEEIAAATKTLRPAKVGSGPRLSKIEKARKNLAPKAPKERGVFDDTRFSTSRDKFRPLAQDEDDFWGVQEWRERGEDE